MNESIKQAMHLDACKSFGAAEANENERISGGNTTAKLEVSTHKSH